MSDSFEQLLARTQHREATPAGSCPDASVLAGYLDATLTAPERARVEGHAADCARCALQLATLVRLEDVSGSPQHAPSPAWWPRLAWMVPAATAVVVAAVYVALPSRGGPQAPPPPHTAAVQERAELKDRNAANPGPLRDLAQDQDYMTRSTDAPAPRGKRMPPAAGAPARRNDALPPASEPAPTQEAASGNTTAEEARITPRELQRKVEGQAPAPSDLRLRERQAAETDSVSQLGAATTTGVRGQLVIRSPDGRVQWRVDGGRIERSTDGGQTWLPERAPAPEAIIMGAAPSVDVCWLASASGQVLRRTDDGTWVDVSPAPRLSIVRLDVSASLDAVASGADGTTMKTADGGRTWVR